jgi:hypothetical protein
MELELQILVQVCCYGVALDQAELFHQIPKCIARVNVSGSAHAQTHCAFCQRATHFGEA